MGCVTVANAHATAFAGHVATCDGYCALVKQCDRCAAIYEAPDSPRQPHRVITPTKSENRDKPGVARWIVQCAKIVPYLLPGKWSSATGKLLWKLARLYAQPTGRCARITPLNHYNFSPEEPLATRQELSDFLASVEKRAFKQAVYAVRQDESALDIVQDSMLKLAEKYSDRPPQELPMLFQRILQNTIRDWFRRSKVRSTWTTLFSSFGSKDDDDDFDILESIRADEYANVPVSPAGQLEQSQLLKIIESAVERLPARQREAFMLRYWEELDVAETAKAMGCSQGSVKTHCSRAVASLSTLLKAKGISLESAFRTD